MSRINVKLIWRECQWTILFSVKAVFLAFLGFLSAGLHLLLAAIGFWILAGFSFVLAWRSSVEDGSLRAFVLWVADIFDWHAEYERWDVPDDREWTQQQIEEWCMNVRKRMEDGAYEGMLATDYGLYVRKWVDSGKWKGRVNSWFKVTS